jgi:hypothetical protein
MVSQPTQPLQSTVDSVIHIDMTNMLMNLPVCTLVRLANISLNTMDMRTLGEVAFSAGIELDISFKDKTNG